MSDSYINTFVLFILSTIFIVQPLSWDVPLPIIGRSKITVDLMTAPMITTLLLCLMQCIGITPARPLDILVLFMSLDGGNTQELFFYFDFLLTTITTLDKAAKENGVPIIPDKRKIKKRKKRKGPAAENDPEGETIVPSTLKMDYKKVLGAMMF